MTTDNKNSELREQLSQLKKEHKELDLNIQDLLVRDQINQLEVSRLKKKKLQLKDYISKIECQILPDIIA